MTPEVASRARVQRIEPVWGTAVTIDVRDVLDPVAVERAVDEVMTWFARVDDLFSTWRDDTEISRLARGELEVDHASDEVRGVLARCEELRIETEGAFDISVGGRARVAPRAGLAPLDPSGYVKGWAVERAAAMLARAGAEHLYVNAGGDVAVRGGRAVGSPWRVGIQHPWERDKVAAVVALADGAVATSGSAERGDHVLDPRTGLPAAGLVSVSVIGPDLGTADALATAAVAAGSIDVPWILDSPGICAMGITDDAMVLMTPGFERYRAD